MRRALLLPLLLMALSGCGHGSDPAGPTRTATSGQAVTAGLQDRFLFDHNAGSNGGRTFRWVPPIPIYMIGPDPSLNEVVLQQFLAWESVLGGVVGTPFYTPLGVGGRVPTRGILFVRHTIQPQPGCGAPPPGAIIAGCSNPFQAPSQSPQFPLAEQPRTGEAVVPEVTAGGEIRTCVSQLDPNLSGFGTFASQWVLRHEIGRCLGFLGTVSQGVMRPACCPAGSSLAISADVVGMMRKLYSLPPGTEVTP